MQNTNPLEEPLWHVFRQLNAAYGILYHLKYQLENYVAAMREKLDGGRAQAADIFVGTTLVVRDITEVVSDGVWRSYPSGVFSTEGEEYFEAASQIIGRNAIWTVAQGWERFESFLFDIVAAFLAQHPQEAERAKLQKFLTKRKLSVITSEDEWRQFVRAMYRGKDNEDLLKYIRVIAPSLSQGETQNHLKLSLLAWYKVVAMVRHVATHSGDLIPTPTFKDLTSSYGPLLTGHFPGNQEQEGYRLQLRVEDARRALELFADYAFLVFKALSIRAGYNWDILDGSTGKP